MMGVVPLAAMAMAMAMVDCTDVGISTVSKAAMTKGLSNFVFVVYYNALGTLILLPHFIFKRSKRASLTVYLLCRFFLIGLIGSLAQILGFTSIKYSSPTLSSAMSNLIPIFTFSLAIIFRLQLLSSIQCAIFSLTVERTPNAWTLRPGIMMTAIACSAIFGSVFRNSVHTWCLREKGPAYVAMFKPLGIAIAVIIGVTFLGDTLHLGSVIGAVIIALGFYTVMWGQANEKNLVLDNGVCSLESSTLKTPLLQSNSMEEI